jgi:LPPG:FO 2-phospho-L-lactate transferase
MSGALVVLSGGVGGAKLVEGAYALSERAGMVVIVNTGDDFCHLGLQISPDIDSVLYALAGYSDRERGWGRQGESWQFMQAIRELGGPTWFNLGDLDLATHVMRTLGMRDGQSLSEVTSRMANAWAINAQILPMTNEPVATIIETNEGPLPFQRYFVERQCAPALQGVHFQGSSDASPAPGVVAALAGAATIIIAPSNPFLSVDPILAVPGIREALEAAKAPVIAISPLIGGQSIKGPTSKIMAELGMAGSNDDIVAHYAGLIDGIVTHISDPVPPTIESAQTDTLMQNSHDKSRVAQCALDLARRITR